MADYLKWKRGSLSPLPSPPRIRGLFRYLFSFYFLTHRIQDSIDLVFAILLISPVLQTLFVVRNGLFLPTIGAPRIKNITHQDVSGHSEFGGASCFSGSIQCILVVFQLEMCGRQAVLRFGIFTIELECLSEG